MPQYDAVIIGSGPNGLAAAIRLAQQGLRTLIIEGKATLGGGMRTAELIKQGYKHDICSAIHPLGVASPFFSTLPLREFGLEWIFPPAAVAHPFDDGSAILLHPSVEQTAAQFGLDQESYLNLMDPLVKNWNLIDKDLLSPFGVPSHPLPFFKFGIKAIHSARSLSNKIFKTEKAKGFLAGLAAHSIVPLNSPFTAAMALVLGILGHAPGWPLPKGGSQSITDALVSYYRFIGGEIITSTPVIMFSQLPTAKAYLFDVTPKQLVNICGDILSPTYIKRLNRFRYGAGVFKLDWILSAPIPWKSDKCNQTATIHIGGKFEEIEASERSVWEGIHSEHPYIIVAQQTLFDSTRVPEFKPEETPFNKVKIPCNHHVVWGYCHVPSGSTVDMTQYIENQIERFAPGFKDSVLHRHKMNTDEFEEYNPNYIGGDINGGVQDWKQLFTRPIVTLSPYSTSKKGVYLCSSSTPPGGGVHGMCGYHAAGKVLKDLFNK